MYDSEHHCESDTSVTACMAPSIATPMHIHPIKASRSFSTIAKFFQTPLEPISLQKSMVTKRWKKGKRRLELKVLPCWLKLK